jgi:redox-sensitive bicupin YhaK (pirin superfamily)
MSRAKAAQANAGAARRIVRRTRGRTHGTITRLMSPSDEFARMLKPFVFLDRFESDRSSFTGTDLHPHSGIVTVTYLFEGSVRYEDTTGTKGTFSEGGVEWFKAGGGAWHGGGPGDDPRMRGFQLWIALPAEHELDSAESIYLPPDAVERDGPVSVIVGSYGDAKSSLMAPTSMNYLAGRLKDGETWSYKPPADHEVGWIAVSKGRLATPEPIEAGELAAFEPSSEAISIRAEGETQFVLGSAPRHPHDLVLGYYSVHTSAASLEKGERQIAEIAANLKRHGRP